MNNIILAGHGGRVKSSFCDIWILIYNHKNFIYVLYWVKYHIYKVYFMWLLATLYLGSKATLSLLHEHLSFLELKGEDRLGRKSISWFFIYFFLCVPPVFPKIERDGYNLLF